MDVGGAKRLQALSALVVALMLVPWALVQFFSLEVRRLIKHVLQLDNDP